MDFNMLFLLLFQLLIPFEHLIDMGIFLINFLFYSVFEVVFFKIIFSVEFINLWEYI